MFDDISNELFYVFIIVALVALYVLGCYCGYVNTKPEEIKDTKCMYYEEQIYCLQENTSE